MDKCGLAPIFSEVSLKSFCAFSSQGKLPEGKIVAENRNAATYQQFFVIDLVLIC